MRDEVKARPHFKIYKIKVGFESDVEAVAAVRSVTINPCTWTPTALDRRGSCAKLPRLARLGVVLCEQPIFSGVRSDWDAVRDASPSP